MSLQADSLINAAPQTGGVRFAPSPTGTFHIGNLRTAWISAQFAKAWNLPWVVRFEDIDRPRVVVGAQQQQLNDMKQLGLTPDVVLLQSEFFAHHLDLFQRAKREGMIYPCNCSRKDVQAALGGLASAPHDGVAPVYSGRCRQEETVTEASFVAEGGLAWRFKMPGDGQRDFIIARTKSLIGLEDFIPSYHWACAIDDFDGDYDLIVRSSDLATALPLQRAIQDWLQTLESPVVARRKMRAFHTSLVTQESGHRLEKRTLGVTLAELLETGLTIQELLEMFIASFDSRLLMQANFAADGVLQEPAEALKILLSPAGFCFKP